VTDPETRRIAERHHDRMEEWGHALTKAANDGSTVVLRTMILINGGAAVAMLTFLGTLVGQGKIAADNIKTVTPTLLWFVGGVAAGALGMVFAYLMNYFASREAMACDFLVEHPYLGKNEDTRKFHSLNYWFHVLAILAIIASVIFFIGGLFVVQNAIIHLKPPP
jgi:CDP-diglyceride synthetase